MSTENVDSWRFRLDTSRPESWDCGHRGSRDCKQISNLYRLTQFRKTMWCFSYAWGIRWKVVVVAVVRWKKSSGRNAPPKKSCPCTHVVKKPGTNFVRHECYLIPFMTIRTQLDKGLKEAFCIFHLASRFPGSKDFDAHFLAQKIMSFPWNAPETLHVSFISLLWGFQLFTQ